MRATGGRMPPLGAGSALRSSFYPQTQAAGWGWLPSLSSWIWTCRPTSAGSSKKQESSRKPSTSALLTTPKPLCGSQQTVENSLGDGNTRAPYLPPEKSVCWSRSSSYNPIWNNRLVPNQERSTSGCILSPYLFNIYTEYIM